MYTQFGHTICMELLNIFIPVEGGLYSRYPATSINRNKSRAMRGERDNDSDNDPVFFFFPTVDSVLIEWRVGPAVHWQQFHKPILALHWITSIIFLASSSSLFARGGNEHVRVIRIHLRLLITSIVDNNAKNFRKWKKVGTVK